jgi:hypothetical protein
MHIIWGDAIVLASPRSASSCAGRCFYLLGLMKRNERVADLIEKAGREVFGAQMANHASSRTTHMWTAPSSQELLAVF